MNQFKSGIFITAILTGILLLTFAVYVFPIPGTDSMVFMPTAVLYSKGLGLANPLYFVTKITDLTHTNRFNYYVPFFPFFLGLLGKIKPDVRTLFTICALFSCTNLLLYANVISSRLPKNINRYMKALVLLSITYMATYLLPTVGRPENFTCLFVFLVYIIHLNRKTLDKKVHFLAAALLFAFMLATQIICFYFCFLIYVLYDIIDSKNVWLTIGKNFVLFLVIGVVFCIVLALSPNGLVNTIEGIGLHIKFVMTRNDNSLSSLIYFWIMAPLNVGFIAVFLLASYFFGGEMMGKLATVDKQKKIFCTLIIAAIAIGLFKFVLYASPTVYNATEFILPLTAYTVLKIASITRQEKRRVLNAVALTTYCIGTLMLCRVTLLFTDTMISGKDYASAKKEVQQFIPKNKKVIATNGLWSLFDDDINNLTLLNLNSYKPGDTLILQETYLPFPLPVDTFTVVHDWRKNEPVNFLGITIAERPYGFGFIVCAIK